MNNPLLSIDIKKNGEVLFRRDVVRTRVPRTISGMRLLRALKNSLERREVLLTTYIEESEYLETYWRTRGQSNPMADRRQRKGV